MKGKFLRSYRSKNGNTTFVYAVSGSADQIDEFKIVQGDYFRESDDGKPLWFTTRYAGETVSLVLTQGDNQRYIPDMSAYEKAASLADQFKGTLGQEIAKQSVTKLLGTKQESPVPTEVPADDQPF